MPAELMAVGAAIGFALGMTAMKLATRAGNMMLGYLVTLATSIVVMGVMAIFTVETWAVPAGPLLLFALGGVAGPGAGRLLGMRAVRDVGTSVAAPVQSSSNPIVATLVGVAVFGESLGPGRVLTLAVIVAGIWACVRGGTANRLSVPAPRSGRLLVLLLPLSAGAAYATMMSLNKLALAEHGDPVLGAFVGLVTAFAIWLTIYLLSPRLRRRARFTPALAWFSVSGVMSAGAQFALLSALEIGDLSVVATIVAAQPVVVILLGALLLRDLERLRPGTVLGAVIVFAGVAYLSVA